MTSPLTLLSLVVALAASGCERSYCNRAGECTNRDAGGTLEGASSDTLSCNGLFEDAVPVESSQPPPPITGGSLAAMADGTWVVADADRAMVWHIGASEVLGQYPLRAGDGPGRVLAAGTHAFILLRGGNNEPCAEHSTVLAFRVTLAPTDVDGVTCWQGGVVLIDHTLPAATFEVAIASRSAESTLGLAGFPVQQLGNVAIVKVGEGLAKTSRGFVWTEISRTRRQALDDAIEQRTSEAIFEFDRFDIPETAGGVTLTSQWECQPGPPPRNAPCGPAPADASRCAVTRRFTAVQIALPSRWSMAAEPRLEGAGRFLVSLDLGGVSASEIDCGISEQSVPTSNLTPTLRALEVWQANSTTVRPGARSFQLGNSPSIDLASDFNAPLGNSISQTVVSMPSADVTKTQTIRATLLSRECGISPALNAGTAPSDLLRLLASADCVGSGCPQDTTGNPVHTSCQLDLRLFSILLP